MFGFVLIAWSELYLRALLLTAVNCSTGQRHGFEADRRPLWAWRSLRSFADILLRSQVTVIRRVNGCVARTEEGDNIERGVFIRS